MRPVSLIVLLVLTTGLTAHAAEPFSAFKVRFNYNLTQSPMTSINEDIRELDAYYHSGDWATYIQQGQGGGDGDGFSYPLLIDTPPFQNLPSYSVKLETNLTLLWHIGLEYNQGGVSSHSYAAYAPAGQNDGSVKRRETLNYYSGLLYGKFQIRDRNLPLYAYIGGGIGYASLNVEGLYELSNKFNADYMQRWLVFTNDHSGSAFTGRGFLGMEYQLPFASILFVECGYNYQNFGELDGSTDMALNNPYDQDPDNDHPEYYSMEGGRPATIDYVYDFLYYYEDLDGDYRYDPDEPYTDTYTGDAPYEGDYNGDFIEFDLSGFYLNFGLGISF